SRQIVIEPAWGGGAFRFDHFSSGNNAGWAAFGFSNTQTASLVGALKLTLEHSRVQNPVLPLRTPDQAEHIHILAEELRGIVAGKNSANQALTNAVKRWQQLDEQKDLNTRSAHYHYSLGLQ